MGWKLATFLFCCALPTVAFGAVGSGDASAFVAQLPTARQDPARVVRDFRAAEIGRRERRILFMVLMALGEEDRLAQITFRDLVRTGLRDVDDKLRGHAIHSLKLVDSKTERQDKLRNLTLDRALLVRYNAAEAMAELPHSDGVPYLAALLGDSSIEVRGRAAGTLCQWHLSGRIDGIRAVFLEAAKSPQLERAGCASLVLSASFSEKPNPTLWRKYLDGELRKRAPQFAPGSVCEIIRAIVKSNDQKARPILTQAAKHENRSVAEAARAALAALASQPSEGAARSKGR